MTFTRPNIQTFTSSGTWTPPGGPSGSGSVAYAFVLVKAWGAGGGGGGVVRAAALWADAGRAGCGAADLDVGDCDQCGLCGAGYRGAVDRYRAGVRGGVGAD